MAQGKQYRASTILVVDPARGYQANVVPYLNFALPTLRAEVKTDAFSHEVVGGLPEPLRRRHSVSTKIDTGTGLLTISVDSAARLAVAPLADAYARKLIEAQPPRGPLHVRVLAAAVTPTSPEGRRRLVILVSGGVLTLIAAAAAAMLAEARRRRRLTGAKVQSELGLRTLAEIPRARDQDDDDLWARRNGLADSYITLRTTVEVALMRGGPSTFSVTSLAGDGKTAVASNLARGLVLAGHQVRLIEADVRNPQLESVFAEELAGATRSSVDGLRVAVVHADGNTAMRLVSAGSLSDHASSHTGASRILHPADIVGISLPPLIAPDSESRGVTTLIDAPSLGSAETRLIVAMAPNVIVVVDARRHDALEKLRDGVEAVREVGGDVFGVVLNRVDAN
jgi:hypothetical protein